MPVDLSAGRQRDDRRGHGDREGRQGRAHACRSPTASACRRRTRRCVVAVAEVKATHERVAARAPRAHLANMVHGRHQGLREEARARRRRLPRRRAGQEPEPDARLLAPGHVPGARTAITIETPSQTEIVDQGRRPPEGRPGRRRDPRLSVRPEPYKGKGVRYSGEKIVLKEGEEEVSHGSSRKRHGACVARRRGRAKIRELGTARLTVHRTPQHIYAQVIDAGRRQGARGRVDRAGGRCAKELKGTGNVDGGEGRRPRDRRARPRPQASSTGRLRPLGIPVPRARQGARRGRARSGSRVLRPDGQSMARVEGHSPADELHREAGGGQPHRRRSSRAAASSASRR